MNRNNLTLAPIVCLFLVFIFSGACQSQPAQEIGGPCEGCEAIFEYGDKVLLPVDTLPGFEGNTPKLKITGKVFHKDGKTPAAGVILYVYHTNREGIYETKSGAKGWARRHGYIRGWMKTGKEGAYTFYTFRPAAYPNGREAEHIHLTVKEPGKNEYYADSFVFSDDPLLKKMAKGKWDNRCGSGIVKLQHGKGISIGVRNIILGKNIPNYP